MASTSYPLHAEDWRGRFIYDMATALGKRSSTKLSLWAPAGPLPLGVASALLPGDAEWLADMLEQGGIAHLLRTRKLAGVTCGIGLLHRLGQVIRKTSTDVAHINWLQNALALWGTSTPAVITVLGSDFRLLALPGMRQALRHVLKQRRAMLAPNAEWMAPELNRAFGDVADIRPVPFGVNRQWFEVDRSGAGSGCWIAITRLTRNKIGDLFAWGEGMFGSQRQLHLFGPMQESLELPPWVIWHGPTHPAELRDQWFPRATGLISLSRHDEGRPQVILEAMAAGLPVIASDLPAHRDFVRHRETGWLVQERSQLEEAFAALEDMPVNRRVGEEARRCIKETIGDWDDCADRYSALYQSLVAR